MMGVKRKVLDFERNFYAFSLPSLAAHGFAAERFCKDLMQV